MPFPTAIIWRQRASWRKSAIPAKGRFVRASSRTAGFSTSGCMRYCVTSGRARKREAFSKRFHPAKPVVTPLACAGGAPIDFAGEAQCEVVGEGPWKGQLRSSLLFESEEFGDMVCLRGSRTARRLIHLEA
jgi:hypothetical protein